jgi:hypothetical protein
LIRFDLIPMRPPPKAFPARRRILGARGDDGTKRRRAAEVATLTSWAIARPVGA